MQDMWLSPEERWDGARKNRKVGGGVGVVSGKGIALRVSIANIPSVAEQEQQATEAVCVWVCVCVCVFQVCVNYLYCGDVNLFAKFHLYFGDKPVNHHVVV